MSAPTSLLSNPARPFTASFDQVRTTVRVHFTLAPRRLQMTGICAKPTATRCLRLAGIRPERSQSGHQILFAARGLQQARYGYLGLALQEFRRHIGGTMRAFRPWVALAVFVALIWTGALSAGAAHPNATKSEPPELIGRDSASNPIFG
jgi:hypothetical protein